MSRSTSYNIPVNVLAILDARPESRTELFHQALSLSVNDPRAIPNALGMRPMHPITDEVRSVGVSVSSQFKDDLSALSKAFSLSNENLVRLALEALIHAQRG